MGEGRLLESYIIGEFPAAMRENSLGHLCGYLGVPPTHPWYGQHELYGQVELYDIDVHGGVTYTRSSYGGHPAEIAYFEKLIARDRGDSYRRLLVAEHEHAGEPVNYPIETDMDIWWIGFDCGHLHDAPRPGSDASRTLFGDGSFKDEAYVRRELEKLATQAAEAMTISEEPQEVRS